MLIEITVQDKAGLDRDIWVESGHDLPQSPVSGIKRLISAGQYEEALLCAESMIVDSELDQAETDLNAARALIYVDRVDEGIAQLKRIIARLEGGKKTQAVANEGNPLSYYGARRNQILGRAHNDLGYALANYRDDYIHAVKEYHKSLTYSEASHLDEERGNSHDNIGRVFVALGCHAQARYWIERSWKLRCQIRSGLRVQLKVSPDDKVLLSAYRRAEYRVALSLISRAEAALAAGEVTKAERAGGLALRICQRLGMQRGIGLASIPLGAALQRKAFSGRYTWAQRMQFLVQSKEYFARARAVFGATVSTDKSSGTNSVLEPLRVRILDKLDPGDRDRSASRRQEGTVSLPDLRDNRSVLQYPCIVAVQNETVRIPQPVPV